MQTVSELIQEKTIEVIGVNIISHFYNDSSNYSDCSHSDAWK